MKTAIFSGMMMLTCLAMAESAWQVLETGASGKYLYQAGEAAYLVTSDGAVLETVDGLGWEQVAQLGEAGLSVQVVGPIRAEAGLAVVVISRDREADIARTSVYRTLDGVNWETAIDGAALGVDNVALNDPVRLPDGWLMWTEGNPPAVIWHSVDGLSWAEVYRDDAIALASGLRQTGEAHAINVDGEFGGGWLQSADGLDWSFASAQPGTLIQMDGYSVGLNNAPVMPGIIYYSTDGKVWDLVLAPAVSSPSKRLIYASGTFVLSAGGEQVFTSHDGLLWSQADIDSVAIRALGTPLKVTLVYAGDRFWYQLQVMRPPGFAVPDPDRLSFASVDGTNWTPSEWRDDLIDEAVHPVANPLYVNPPGPVGPPGVELAGRAREIRIDGYALKMEEIPEGGQMGLYLQAGGGEYQVVNSSFGQIDLYYPYTEPVAIAAVGSAFVALNKSGRLGYLDPAADHLPQPMVTASSGKFDDHIELSWLPVDGAASYRIFRTKVGDEAVVEELDTVTGPAFADWHDLDSLAVYEYRVQSLADGRASFLSLPAEGRLWSLLYGTGSASWGEIVIPGWPPTYVDPDGNLPRQKPALTSADRSHYPWLYSSDHHWLYCHERPGHLWLWDTQLGWLWTRSSYYPYLYSVRDKSWLCFIAAGEHVRWFYHYADTGYLPLER